MNMFLSYVLLGLSLSAPIGPINAAQIDCGIKFGFWNAWLIGIGGMVADVIFMLLIYFGIAEYLTTPMIKTFLWSFGAFILIYTGIEGLLSKANPLEATRSGSGAASESFRFGLFMALSNPLNILFWLGIYGSILAKTAESHTNVQLLLYSGGIFLGIIVWDLFMASIATSARNFLKPSILRGITLLASISLIGFGVYFACEAFHIIFS
ncbi:amino acid transporter [Pontibacillus halophilus JSM 076056 = DSM 19796]|uniref:Amino acid transporter n=1 Tax=Pontibacillus halophilus JSM 076056 = DSM 19796 TaxID=1385510 RepID=A0A0A5I9E4_9BACI|nr:LysE family transporter [Pontibacillus halophilus]KGX92452.1 amino acid transporter [Pontibacillus halophilus JSM 076056 = DSM 19796]